MMPRDSDRSHRCRFDEGSGRQPQVTPDMDPESDDGKPDKTSRLLVMWRRLTYSWPLLVFASFSTSALGAPVPTPAPLFRAWSAYFAGDWDCLSGKTPYSVTYHPALNDNWIRGINVSRASSSEDMLTYDSRTRRWTLFDMEPTGASFVMNGWSGPNDIHLTDDHKKLSLVLHRIGKTSYSLTFFTPNGKPAGADTCRRRLNTLGK
jgi:hypothetical protein